MTSARGVTAVGVLLAAGFLLRGTAVASAALGSDERAVALRTWAVPKPQVQHVDRVRSRRASVPTRPTPVGVPGRWRMTFDDEFTGTRLNTSKWATHDGWTKQNHVTTLAKNVMVFGGEAHLVLSDGKHGAAIATGGSSTNYSLPVGGVVEARILLPGDSKGVCWNWPAWWVSGDKWPRSGEHDIAEVLSGRVTVNYHSPSGAHNKGPITGALCGKWHTYALHRQARYAEVLLDGKVVRRYPTDDNGAPEALLLSHGVHARTDHGGTRTGRLNAVRVDYVRAWAPAS